MKMHKTLMATLLSAGLLASAGAQAAGWCESGKPVKFAGLNWESGMLLTDILQTVLEKGYDCKTDSLPGNSITMENALSSNDIQIFAEEWVGRSEVWNKAEKAGKVIGIGAPVVGAEVLTELTPRGSLLVLGGCLEEDTPPGVRDADVARSISATPTATPTAADGCGGGAPAAAAAAAAEGGGGFGATLAAGLAVVYAGSEHTFASGNRVEA